MIGSVIATLAFAGSGPHIISPFFSRVAIPEQFASQINGEQQEKLKKEADEDAKLAASGLLPNLTVEEIAASADRYDKRLVRLRGCVVSGFETFFLMECAYSVEARRNGIYLESSIEHIRWAERMSGRKEHWRDPPPQTQAEVRLLKKLARRDNKITPTTIEGEFQKSQRYYAQPGDFKYRLIVHRVLEAGGPMNRADWLRKK
ncbi:MAG: hypothetical protein WBN92_05630 [Terriglobia bacterium]